MRIRIDEAIGRPDSGTATEWRATWVSAVLLGLLAGAISWAVFTRRRNLVADEFRAGLACIFIAIGVYGIIASSGLLMLSNRFFQSERAGLRLVRLIGVKSLSGIRIVAVGLFLLSSLFFFLPGLYWLFFE